jgi:hypothetical protein
MSKVLIANTIVEKTRAAIMRIRDLVADCITLDFSGRRLITFYDSRCKRKTTP